MEKKFNYQIVLKDCNVEQRVIFAGVTEKTIIELIDSLPTIRDAYIENVVYQPVNSNQNEQKEES